MRYDKNTRKYNLDYIHLPFIHPNPLNSFKISQEIYNLLYNKSDRLLKDFQVLYNSFEIEDQYYLCKYCFEYFSFEYYQTFIQAYFKELEKQGEKEATIYCNDETGETISNPSLSLKYLLKEVEIKKQIDNIIDFLREQFPLITYKLKSIYRERYQELGDLFVPEEFYDSNFELDRNVYQITIANNIDPFINKLRDILKNLPSAEVDTFIYNSFRFKANNKPMELCQLDFGNSIETNRLIHKVYEEYKSIVKKKTSRFDFAKIMYLNFEFVRNNWRDYARNNPNITREEYLKNNIASNIEK